MFDKRQEGRCSDNWNQDMKSINFSFFVICFSLQGNAQIDSLEKVLQQKNLNDTNRVNTMIWISWHHFRNSDQEKSIEWGKKAAELSKKAAFLRGESRSITLVGNAFKERGNYDSALYYHQKALKLRLKTGNQKALADTYNSLGDNSLNLGKYKESIDYFIQSQKIYIQLKDTLGEAWSYCNIGVVLSNQNDTEGAVENYSKASALARKLKNGNALAWYNNNLGNAYLNLMEYDKAKECFEESLRALQIKDVNKMTLAFTYNSMGNLYDLQGNPMKAIPLYEKALALRQEINDQNGVAWSLMDIGGVSLKAGKYTDALRYFIGALGIAKTIKQPERIRDSYHQLSETYFHLGNFKNAYEMHVNYARIKDSMLDGESNKAIHDMKEKHKAEKKDQEIKLLNKEKSLSDLENKNNKIEIEHQRSQRYFLIAGCISILLIALYIFSRFRSSQKQKKIIETHKEILEEKNHEITQSIQYAQKIQTALLPSEKELKKIFPRSFVLFMPKDIVSGDFFWWSDKGDKFYYATADCTGHGVPGGFMSMLGMSLLNEIVDELRVTDCGTILNMMRDKIMHSLKQEGEGESKDGMDMALICIDKKILRMEFAAANNPILIFDSDSNEMVETPYDKMPVGVFIENAAGFKTHSHQLKKGDRLFTFTDGYADQFGGEKRKKFKYSSMKKLFNESTALDMAEIKNLLESKHHQWKGDLEQLDDICIIGIKV